MQSSIQHEAIFEDIYNQIHQEQEQEEQKQKQEKEKEQKQEEKQSNNDQLTANKICRNCGSCNLFIDQTTANKICQNCGVLFSKIFTADAEWRYYGHTDDNKHSDPTRCGLPIDELLPKSSLTTKIKYVGNKYISLVRLHKWNVIHPEERSLFTVFKYMDNIFKNVNFCITNSAILQAKEYYKILSAKDNRKGTLTRGIIRKSFIAACIFVSCKNNQTPIQKGEIAEICGISKFAITKGFKKFSVLEKNKNIQLNKPNNNHITIHNYLKKFANQLHYSQTMQDIAHIIFDRLPSLKLLQDTNDISISAGLLYYIAILFQKEDKNEPQKNIKKPGKKNKDNQKKNKKKPSKPSKKTKQTKPIKPIKPINPLNTTDTMNTMNRMGLPNKYGLDYKIKILEIINTSIVTLQKVYKILKNHEKYILIGLYEFI